MAEDGALSPIDHPCNAAVLAGIGTSAMSTSIERIPVKTIDGTPSSLSAYAGKVRLVVNVASQCGLTPQYAGLEALYQRYKSRGFAILGFPANEFGAQEPGTDAEIRTFCSSKYDVTFPMFSKIVVRGEGQSPLYAALTSAQPEARSLAGSNFREKLVEYGIRPGAESEILWNFEKFLVDRKGNVVERFSPDLPPESNVIISAIERELDASAESPPLA